MKLANNDFQMNTSPLQIVHCLMIKRYLFHRTYLYLNITFFLTQWLSVNLFLCCVPSEREQSWPSTTYYHWSSWLCRYVLYEFHVISSLFVERRQACRLFYLVESFVCDSVAPFSEVRGKTVLSRTHKLPSPETIFNLDLSGRL